MILRSLMFELFILAVWRNSGLPIGIVCWYISRGKFDNARCLPNPYYPILSHSISSSLIKNEEQQHIIFTPFPSNFVLPSHNHSKYKVIAVSARASGPWPATKSLDFQFYQIGKSVWRLTQFTVLKILAPRSPTFPTLNFDILMLI